MTATTATKTRKPRTTAASLIAAEFASRQPLPTPEPTASDAPVPAPASPVILIFILAVAAIAIFKLATKAIALLLPIASQAAKFVNAQRGGRVIDFRVYDPIFG